jgi:hypothetical protein
VRHDQTVEEEGDEVGLEDIYTWNKSMQQAWNIEVQDT